MRMLIVCLAIMFACVAGCSQPQCVCCKCDKCACVQCDCCSCADCTCVAK